MAAIKSFTDLEQSKKLAKILPIESADAFYIIGKEPVDIVVIYGMVTHRHLKEQIAYKRATPCWSLAALLGVLPIVDLCTPALKIKLNHKYYMELCIDWANQKYISTNDYNNPVDACVNMIENLHELKML